MFVWVGIWLCGGEVHVRTSRYNDTSNSSDVIHVCDVTIQVFCGYFRQIHMKCQ